MLLAVGGLNVSAESCVRHVAGSASDQEPIHALVTYIYFTGVLNGYPYLQRRRKGTIVFWWCQVGLSWQVQKVRTVLLRCADRGSRSALDLVVVFVSVRRFCGRRSESLTLQMWPIFRFEQTHRLMCS